MTTQRKYELIVSGPLKRASETAEIISKAFSIPIQIDERWLEIDAGELSGLPKAEGVKRFPPKPFQGPYERIAESRYLVISHGAFLNAAVSMAFNIPIPVNRNGVIFRFVDTGYMDLAYNKEIHRWLLLSFCNG